MENQQATESPNLTLADITLALQIIQVAAQRSAFKPEEFEEVGGCYNRILGFLEASGAVQRGTQGPAAGAEGAAAPTEQPETAAAAKKPAAKSVAKSVAKPKGKTK